MQNSLERLFEGLVVSLRESVLPGLEDPYARSQAAAAIELLGNLAGRVEWRCDALAEEVRRVREVLGAAPVRSPLLDEPVPVGNAALVEARRLHLAELARLQDDPPPALRGLLDEFLTWQLDREMALLATGMYK